MTPIYCHPIHIFHNFYIITLFVILGPFHLIYQIIKFCHFPFDCFFSLFVAQAQNIQTKTKKKQHPYHSSITIWILVCLLIRKVLSCYIHARRQIIKLPFHMSMTKKFNAKNQSNRIQYPYLIIIIIYTIEKYGQKIIRDNHQIWFRKYEIWFTVLWALNFKENVQIKFILINSSSLSFFGSQFFCFFFSFRLKLSIRRWSLLGQSKKNETNGNVLSKNLRWI